MTTQPYAIQQKKRRVAAYLFLVLAGLGVALARHYVGPEGPGSYEAIVRAGVNRDLMDGLTRGRQGLVGSLRWAPLPTLLALPLASAPGLGEGGFGMCVVAAVASALLCVFLSRWWVQYGMGEFVATACAFALFLSPPLLRPILAGTSETLFVFCVVATMAHLIHWWETEELRSLAYMAVSAGAAVYARYQAFVLVALVLMLCLVHLVLRRKRESYVEGTLIALLLPAAYLVALWHGANWLIMEDALFFMRMPLAREGGLLSAGLLTEGAEWEACLIPLLIALLGWGLCRLSGAKRSAWTGVPVLAACGLLWLNGPDALAPRAAPRARAGGAPAFQALDPTSVELRETVLPYLREAHAEHRILVSGYRGYEIRHVAGQADMFVHRLSLYLDEALEDTRGRELYLLVPRADMGDPRWEDIDRWEDANIKYPGIYAEGARGLLYERAWTRWSLWKVVRTDTEDQPL